jgi:GDPmannose 4,6-dehydratase
VKRVLVTGVSGQDGIYLARRLRDEECAVVGVVSPGTGSAPRVAAYLDGVEIVPLDMRDAPALRALVARVEPDAVYNLAAQSSVGRSWQEPELTVAVNQSAVEVLVEAVLALRARTGRDTRFLQASSAEVGGEATDSPYARSKAAAEEVVRAAREESGLHASFARLHVHESPLRAAAFVSRKITRGAAEIALGRRDRLTLGNLDVVRDWGSAPDYVDAIRLMVAAETPADLPIGSGVPHTLAELVDVAFGAAGLGDPASYVEQDPALMRPADTPVLIADPEPAAAALGWRATTTFEELLEHMVAADLARVRAGVEEDPRYLDSSAMCGQQ